MFVAGEIVALGSGEGLGLGIVELVLLFEEEVVCSHYARRYMLGVLLLVFEGLNNITHLRDLGTNIPIHIGEP